MADVDARTVRWHADAPITGLPLAKLHASSIDSPGLSVAGGALDAFAEVFARMSESLTLPTATAGPAEPTVREEETAPPDEDEPRQVTAPHLPGSFDRKQTQHSDAESPEPVITINEPDDDDPALEHSVEVVVPLAAAIEQPSESTTTEPAVAIEAGTEVDRVPVEPPQVASPELELSINTQDLGADVSPEVSGKTVPAKHARPTPVSPETSLESPPDVHAASVELPESVSEGTPAALPVEEQEADPRRTRHPRKHGDKPVGLAEGKRAPQSTVGNNASSSSGQVRLATEITGALESSPSSTTTSLTSGRSESTASPTQATIPNASQVVPTVARTPLASNGLSNSQATGNASNQLGGFSQSPSAASAVASPAKRSEPSTQSDLLARVKLIQRVSRAFQRLGPDGGSVRLRLAPAELGSVRVEMQVHDRKVRARVVAETEAASTALREHLPELRSRLESYGMQIEKIEVETEGSDSGTHHSQDSDSQWQSEHHSRQPQGRRAPIADRPTRPGVDAAEMVSIPPRISGRPGPGVDVRL